MADEPEPGTASSLPILCPECKDRLPDQRALAVHLERHREVKLPAKNPDTGEVVSTPCSMGCGRHFTRPSEYREHNPLCDGSVPLWKPPTEATQSVISEVLIHEKQLKRKKRKEKRMVSCTKCGKKFIDGRGLFGHKQGSCGSGGKAVPAKKKSARPIRHAAARPDNASTSVGDVLRKQAEVERGKARDHEAKAKKLEAMAVDLDTLITD